MCIFEYCNIANIIHVIVHQASARNIFKGGKYLFIEDLYLMIYGTISIENVFQ